MYTYVIVMDDGKIRYIKGCELWLPAYDAVAWKHVGVLTIYEILLIYVRLDNRQYKIHGSYVKIWVSVFAFRIS